MLTPKGFPQKQQQWMENIHVKTTAYQDAKMIMFKKMVKTNKPRIRRT
jgi:hypothetical protein